MTRINRRTATLGLAALAAPALLPRSALTQAKWRPNRPITVYNPLPAGGVADAHLRFSASAWARCWASR